MVKELDTSPKKTNSLQAHEIMFNITYEGNVNQYHNEILPHREWSITRPGKISVEEDEEKTLIHY